MTYAIGQAIRYKPGFGTYGYEDALGADGRVPGLVIGHSRTRVRVKLTLDLGRTIERCVDAASLTPAAHEESNVVAAVDPLRRIRER